MSGGMLLGVDAVVGGGGGGSWALVAHGTANNQGSRGVGTFSTGALDTTGATLLVLAVAQFASVSLATVSDSKGNTWTALSSYSDGSGTPGEITIYYCLSPTVGAGHTFTVTQTGGNNFASACVAAFSGGGSLQDKASGAGSASASSQQPGSVAPAVSGELLVTALSFAATAGTVTIDSGYTITDVYVDGSGTVFDVALAYLSQGSAAASNPTWTRSGSSADRMAAAVATFEA